MPSNLCEEPCAVSRVLCSIEALVELTKTTPFNFKRFESYQAQVLALPVPDQEKRRHNSLMERAKRYIQFGEIGAGQFELKLLIRNLQTLQSQRLDDMSPI